MKKPAFSTARMARIARDLSPQFTILRPTGLDDVMQVVRVSDRSIVERIGPDDVDDLESRMDRGEYVGPDGTVHREIDPARLTIKEKVARYSAIVERD